MNATANRARLHDRTGSTYPIDGHRWRGTDGSPLMVSALGGITEADIDRADRSQWRYRAALPLPLARLSLGEGCTPLLPAAVDGFPVLAKAEWLNPTGSFKDRGTAIMLAMLASQQVSEVLEDSSGNGGASVAAYAAAAGMRAKILVPESTAPGKIVQSRIYGAEIELVPGDGRATSDEALRQAAARVYASRNWHPFFLQGTKMLAYEIWEDLGFHAPDAVIVPAGSGSLVLGCAIGFHELAASGATQHVPRILAVQPRNCSPLAAGYAARATSALDGPWRTTLAEGTSIAQPVRDREVLAAVRGSRGGFQTIAEDAIPGAVMTLAAQGFYVEPTSAIVAAAVKGFERQGLIRAGDTVVMILSGSGLKSGHVMASLLDHRHRQTGSTP